MILQYLSATTPHRMGSAFKNFPMSNLLYDDLSLQFDESCGYASKIHCFILTFLSTCAMVNVQHSSSQTRWRFLLYLPWQHWKFHKVLNSWIIRQVEDAEFRAPSLATERAWPIYEAQSAPLHYVERTATGLPIASSYTNVVLLAGWLRM